MMDSFYVTGNPEKKTRNANAIGQVSGSSPVSVNGSGDMQKI